MPPTGHALLSASSAHRWLVCTAAPRFEEQFPAGETSVYAEEGTLAHEICEITGRRSFKGLPVSDYEARIATLMSDPLFKTEMLQTAGAYVDYLTEKAQTYRSMPYVDFEVRVDLRDIIPDGFGTCDCIMIGGDTLHITDYKHGMGVQVSAIKNPQMMLYAYGALRRYALVYGGAIKHISMGICQPRITLDASEYTMTVDELLAWAQEVKRIAAVAYSGPGEFCPGEHCRFCRGKAVCKARARSMSALEDFAQLVTPDRATPNASNIMTNAQIGEALTLGSTLVSWYGDLQDYAKQAILNGETIPGYKVVAGKSNRAFTIDEKQVREILLSNGLTDADIYKPREMRTLTDLEKQIGKKAFAGLFDGAIGKPIGKPALAVESDKRPDYSSAVKDFQGVAKT